MAYSIISTVGNDTSQYAISFTMGFNSRTEVRCRVNDEVDGLGDPVYKDLTWINDGLVEVADGPYTADDDLVFSRTVDKTELIHNYENGEAIEEINLDESNRQAMMSVHEVLDGRLESPLANDLDMGGFRIINMGAAEDPDDAVTLEQTETVIENLADITTVADNIADVVIVADNIADVVIVADDIADVSAVAAIAAAVSTVSGIAASVSTVAGISANVTDVANIAADVTTVADIAADVTTVAEGINSAAYVEKAGGTMTGPLVLPNGSESAGAIQIGSSGPVHLYRKASGNLGISNGTNDLMTLTKSGNVVRLSIGDSDAANTYMYLETGPNVGDNRAWLRGGVQSPEWGDGTDIAGLRLNGTTSLFSGVLAQDHIAAFYGWGYADTRNTAPSGMYGSYDGKVEYTGTITGTYSYAGLPAGTKTAILTEGIAVLNYDAGETFNDWVLKTLTTDYTVNTGAETITVVGTYAKDTLRLCRRRDWENTGPLLGRSFEVSGQALENYTDGSRHSVALFGVTPKNEVAIRHRMFMKDASSVDTGRGIHENVSGAEYPDNINIGNDLYNKWKGWQCAAALMPDNYVPKAVREIWSPDITDMAVFNGVAKTALAGLALRKDTDPNNIGYDFGTIWGATNYLNIYTVAGGTRTKAVSISSNGKVIVGVNVAAPSGTMHLAANDPKLYLEDTGGGPAKDWSWRSADGNAILRCETENLDAIMVDSTGVPTVTAFGTPGVVHNDTNGVLSSSLIVNADVGSGELAYDKIQNVSATDKILGRSTAGAGTIEEIACTAAGRAILDDVNGSAQLTTMGITAPAKTSLLDSNAVSIPIVLYVGANGDTNDSSSGSGSDYAHNKSYTIPANTIVDGTVLRVTSVFRMTTGTPGSMTVRLKAGSTILCDGTAASPSGSVTNDTYTVVYYIIGTAAAGAAAPVDTSVVATINAVNAGGQRNTIDQPVNLATNGTLAITQTTQWGSAGTGTNTIKQDLFLVEKIA